MKRFTTVFWDVDGTLLDFLYSQRAALTKCFRSQGREVTEEQLRLYSEINDGYWKKLELGEVTKEELLTGRFTALFAACGIEDIDAAAFRDEYEETLGKVFAYKEDSIHICEALRGQVKQYVITNGVTAVQQSKLRLSGLWELMDGVFISEEIGAPKPQTAFFEYCLERIEEKDRSRILIVGDSLSSDIKGGILAGIPTCWYRPAAAVNDTPYRPEYETDTLRGVFDIIRTEERQPWQNQQDRS